MRSDRPRGSVPPACRRERSSAAAAPPRGPARPPPHAAPATDSEAGAPHRHGRRPAATCRRARRCGTTRPPPARPRRPARSGRRPPAPGAHRARRPAPPPRPMVGSGVGRGVMTPTVGAPAPGVVHACTSGTSSGRRRGPNHPGGPDDLAEAHEAEGGVQAFQAFEIPGEAELGTEHRGLASVAFSVQIAEEPGDTDVVDAVSQLRGGEQQRLPDPVQSLLGLGGPLPRAFPRLPARCGLLQLDVRRRLTLLQLPLQRLSPDGLPMCQDQAGHRYGEAGQGRDEGEDDGGVHPDMLYPRASMSTMLSVIG